jgi:amino acid transporter
LSSYFCILVAIEAYIGFASADFLRHYAGISVPWQLLSLTFVAVIGVLGYRHVELSAKLLGVALVLEISIVLLVNFLILIRHAGNGIDLTPVSTRTFFSGSPGLGILFAIFSFAGFEATAVYREEARDPDRTIPRATYAAVLTIGIFYIISMWCAVVGAGTGRATAFATEHLGDMYQLLTQQYAGAVGAEIMHLLLLTSLFACVLSIHNVLVRYKYVFGCYGILPAALAKIHGSHGSPYISSIVQTFVSAITLVILGIIAGLDPVTQLYAWGTTSGTLGYMAILALTALSVVVFFAKGGDQQPVWNVRIAPALGFMGLLGCLAVAIANLPALVGGNNAQLAAHAMVVVNVAAFATGAAAAAIMKSRAPARFAHLSELV